MPQGALDVHRGTLRPHIRALSVTSMPTAARWPLCESWDAELRGEPVQKLQAGQGLLGQGIRGPGIPEHGVEPMGVSPWPC